MAPKYRGNPKYERLYAHAITGMNSLFIRGEGGYTGTTRIPYTGKEGIGIAFFWDTSFTTLGARELNQRSEKRRCKTLWTIQVPGALFPEPFPIRTGRAKGKRPSCLGQLGCLSIQPRQSLAGCMYSGLSGHINFWMKYHVSPRGLAQYFNAGQIGDNDARFDRVYNRNNGEEHSNEPVSGFESPDLNAFLVMEMRSLALMAKELGHENEAAQWKDRAVQLAKLIVDACYFPDEAMFYDVTEGTHEKFSGVKDPNMFLPLWAGVPLPEADVHRIIEKHMLNPDEFFRSLPFPASRLTTPNTNPRAIGEDESGLISFTGWRRPYGVTATTKRRSHSGSPFEYDAVGTLVHGEL